MLDATFTLNDILGMCSIVGVVWGTLRIMKEIKRPSDNLKNKVENHDRYLATDKKRIDEMEQSNKILCKSMLVLINHEITGNGIDKMKQARDELQDYLIER